MRKKIPMVTIKEIRDRENLSHAELAKILMVTEAEVKKFERNQPMIPGSIIMILSLYFPVSIDELVGGKGAKINPYSNDFPY